MNSNLLTQLLENAVSAGVVVLSGVNSLIPTPNPLMNYVKIGTTQVVAEDLVNYVKNGNSLILNFNYSAVFDRIVFASGFAYGLIKTGAPQQVLKMLERSPFPVMANHALVDGAMIMLNRTTADLMDSSNFFTTVPLVYLNHLSFLITGGV